MERQPTESQAVMDMTLNCALARALAHELREARTELTYRWLDRIAARVSLEQGAIFPSEQVLDRMPVLIAGIADYLEDPAEEITADVPVIVRALELGQLRHAQGFSVHEILKEYEILGGVLFAFLVRVVDGVPEPCTRSDLLAFAQRLFRAIAAIQQMTTTQYLALEDEEVREREDLLRGFNRAMSHELKNRIGSVIGAAQLLREEWVRSQPAMLERFVAIVISNVEQMQEVLQDLLALSRTDADSRQQRNVQLPEAVAEVVRQLREFAATHEVAVRVRGPLPELEVNAAVIELCLSNYVSNAIKYSDPEEPERWVEIGGEVHRLDDSKAELVVEVRDNGIGVSSEQRPRLFERFFRSEEATRRGVEGTGLGLSIVRETMESLGGRAWAEFDGDRGSTFKLALPVRRSGEVAGAGGQRNEEKSL